MYKKSIKLILLYLGFIFFVTNTNPSKVPVVLLLVPLLWIFLICYYTLVLVLKYFYENRGWSRTKIYKLSAIIATIPTILLLLNSISQLTPRDIVIVLLLGAVALFYFSRTGYSSAKRIS